MVPYQYYSTYGLVQEGEQEPYDITANWSKMTALKYEDFSVDGVGESVVKIIQDDDDMNWEIKVKA